VPPLYGEGYSSIITLLSGKFANILQNSFFNNLADKNLALIIFTVLIVFSKVIATSLTISSGGNGGIIAPSLFTGAMTGFLLTHTMNYLGLAELDRINFIVVGMAGILSGVLHSPLTGIFLIAEVTGGYVLIVPLMIVTALSFFISKHFHHDSIYIAPLVKDGIKFRSEKERYFIQQMKISDLVEKDFVAILPNMTLRQLVDKITHTNRNLFPVVNENKKLVGIVTLDDVREVMLTTEAYDVILVDEIMNTGYNEIDISADINNVLELFKGKQIWNLAVTDKGTYLGFISKSNLFNNYISVWEHQKKDEM
ncbi:MAG: chloride channel protein, partial [Bacteroidota bacterium]